ncbi:MAG: hypothetical protein GWN99_00680 [Gemmatimonadetes bacterium]|uniref:Uncharacterized protein n=1 Tax=Candidatus Kutchimonas denitrificans TaxID=3056748 RepID=A0AAE5CAR4_9BACT|nr:hypothetical protein [Gemmatimonadota bacterium]NIR73623.1 hypothetical protein [Candidatus Kutchimonas denitrificans]NIR99582.1 hypothetical protein [Gemmatimonadota bacterium]NIT65202.1 hypothetical protein [Gemmatimonadota bacterium]NIV23735.1 hypothetical protein [Gemmatimonadota bacterium]
MWKSRKAPRGPAPGRRIAATAALLGLVGVTAAYGLNERPENVAAQANPIDWDGHRWLELSAAEKEAYLSGFLAGAAAAQAYEALEGAGSFEAQALRQRMAGLRAEKALVFPYAPNLYHARLHDYLFYENNREQPLYQAIAELNFQIGAARR